MIYKKRSLFAKSLAWLLVLGCIGGVASKTIGGITQQGLPASLFDWVEMLGWGMALPVIYSVVGALIIAREPDNRVGWLLMLPALTTSNPIPLYYGNFIVPPTALTPGLWLALWLYGWSWIPVIFPVFLIPLHFPTGRPPSRRWGWVNWVAGGLWLFLATFSAVSDRIGPLDGTWTFPNPIGFVPLSSFDGPLAVLWGLGLALVVSSSVASLLVRYKRAHQVERQQIKWLLYSAGLFAVYYIPLLIRGGNDAQNGWLDGLFVIAILGIPISIAIAILRYRLYNIDIIIRRTLVYSILSAIMGLVYFGGVTVLQSIFTAFTGQQSPIATVLSTLAIAALFTPLRRRVQEFIDRRFYRSKYNAELAMEKFAKVARDEVDMERLTEGMFGMVQETMQPDKIGIWLKLTHPIRRSIEH